MSSNLNVSKTISLLLAIFFAQITQAQDTIKTRSGDIIVAKVSDIGTTEIKYKKIDNLDGPNYSVLKSDVLSITYKNGTKDTFSSAKGNNDNQTNNSSANTINYYNADSTFYYNYPIVKCKSSPFRKKAQYPGTDQRFAAHFNLGGKEYMGLGNYGDGKTNTFWEYDPTNDKWAQKADYPGKKNDYCSSFSVGQKGYVALGGEYMDGTNKGYNGWIKFPNCSQVWQYDPETDSWEKKKTFPGEDRTNALGFSIGSKGYIFGGFTVAKTGLNRADHTGEELYDLWEYDTATDKWTKKNDCPLSQEYRFYVHSYMGSFVIGTKVYVLFFGWYGDYIVTYAWDQLTDTWTRKANLFTPFNCPCDGLTFSIGSKGYIGTGDDPINDNKYCNVIYEYDTTFNIWRAIPFGFRWYDATGFSINGRGYLTLGELYINNKRLFNNNLFEFNPPYAPITNEQVMYQRELDSVQIPQYEKNYHENAEKAEKEKDKGKFLSVLSGIGQGIQAAQTGWQQGQQYKQSTNSGSTSVLSNSTNRSSTSTSSNSGSNLPVCTITVTNSSPTCYMKFYFDLNNCSQYTNGGLWPNQGIMAPGDTYTFKVTTGNNISDKSFSVTFTANFGNTSSSSSGGFSNDNNTIKYGGCGPVKVIKTISGSLNQNSQISVNLGDNN